MKFKIYVAMFLPTVGIMLLSVTFELEILFGFLFMPIFVAVSFKCSILPKWEPNESVYLIGALEQVPAVESGRQHIQIMSSRAYAEADVISHWICTYFDGASVRIFDSLNQKKLTAEQQAFLDRLYPQKPTVIFEGVQQQHNGIDCGVYAMAFATSLALGGNPTEQTYDVPQMRGHLLDLIFNGAFTPFPTVPAPKKKGRPKKVKRGRPKTSTLTSKEQATAAMKKYSAANPEVNQKAVQRYTEKNPEVNRKAVQRYTEKNPEVHQKAVAKYSQNNPEDHKKAAKRYREGHKDDVQQAKKIARCFPPELRYNSVEISLSLLSVTEPLLPSVTEPVTAMDTLLASPTIFISPAVDTVPTIPIVPTPIMRPVYIANRFGQQLDDVNAIALMNLSLLSKDVKRCKFCNAAFFDEEVTKKMWCCRNGALHSESLPKIDAEVYSNREFLKNIRSYNNLFAFSAIGTTHGFQTEAAGASFVKVQGKVYHRIFDLGYTGGGVNSTSLYIDDGEQRQHLGQERTLSRNIINSILQYLKIVSPLIGSLRMLSQHASSEAHIVFQATNRRMDGPVLGDMPNSKEIAGLLKTSYEYTPRQVVVWKIGFSKPHTVPYLSPSYEALQYPLLFPKATAGYAITMKDKTGKKVTQAQFYRYRWLSEERFGYLRRLGQEYIVDMWCQIEEHRLEFLGQPAQQRALRIATRTEIDETIAGNTETAAAGKVFLPASFTNGPRFMLTKYLNSMAVVSRLGKPSFFLTVTCNPNWKEIKDSMFPGQTYSDRPDLCVRVFQLKLAKLMAKIKSGHLFGPIIYIQYVIEFQKRGLPHAHIVFRVAGGGPINSMDIDSFVRATIPSQEEAGGRLRPLVVKHMMHGPCGINNMNCPCMDKKRKKCTKMFPKPYCEVTNIDQQGFLKYKRPESGEQHLLDNGRMATNQWIVPYNAAVLLLMECHCNLEIATTSKVIKYLYKYLHKGPDHAKATVMQNINADNEIDQYVNYRYISASEALWRLFEYGICFCTPAVTSLPIHLMGRQNIIFREGDNLDAAGESMSKLQLYLSRPAIPEFVELTYLDFYERYNVDAKARPKATVPVTPHPDGKHFITRRIRRDLVARINFIPPSLGELFYFRMLLIRFACSSYESLRTINGHTYSTFQEAAQHHGLLNNETEFREAMQEAVAFKTGRELRRLFFIIIISGGPAFLLWDEFKDSLCDDFLRKDTNNPERGYAYGLTAIDRMLRMHGRNLADMGLPVIADTSNETGRERIRWNITSCEEYFNEWEPKLSLEQRTIYSYVLTLLGSTSNRNLKRVIFVDGPAGTGKTVLLRTITAKLRSTGHIILCTATTGIAALNYEGGITAHSMFKLPINELHGSAVMNVTGRSQRAELIRQASVIILDEAPMAHRCLIECLSRGLMDICQSSEPFGGKVVLLAGDFRQIPPVILNGTVQEVIAASLRNSELWTSMRKMALQSSHRSSGDPDYAAFILAVGEDRIPTVNLAGTKTIALSGIVPERSIESLLRFVYPQDLLNDASKSDECCGRAILSGTNVNIDEINGIMLDRLPGESVHFYSADSLVVTDLIDPADYMGQEILNQMGQPGVPDHHLKLKIGSIVMLIRNLSFEDGLVNGTKLIITNMSRLLVEARFPGSERVCLIPRICFRFTIQRNGLEMQRRQFPLRLAYALTINKAQGQTLNCVGIDLRSDVFAHGQLYVALGRVRSRKSIRVVVHPDRILNGVAHCINIVHRELLLALSTE